MVMLLENFNQNRKNLPISYKYHKKHMCGIFSVYDLPCKTNSILQNKNYKMPQKKGKNNMYLHLRIILCSILMPQKQYKNQVKFIKDIEIRTTNSTEANNHRASEEVKESAKPVGLITILPLLSSRLAL